VWHSSNDQCPWAAALDRPKNPTTDNLKSLETVPATGYYQWASMVIRRPARATPEACRRRRLSSVSCHRQQSKLHSPFSYNKWIDDLKVKLLTKHGRVHVESEGTKVDVNLWLHFVFKEKLSLISQSESPMSNISNEDQQNFYVTKVRVLKNDEEDEMKAMLE